ncbi:hypothetical protein EHEL_020340 [Encephalitozoon hellem ATCC 50504]|uniref:SANT/Myb-like DNA-binding domain-containing protein n=1 Tax=Encephalitozoon hellem TaxID=27973 RepID=A0A9Q9F8Z0_ENCHE|nr:uncharacterized protein EHEL_020340 [Encephalitozoon hellem ATCC 50504]AFM97792.1 hypothetical protein EHEL_020340 [Encephalitozoon hellem ATCC 50504]UTX42562.1 SANT/Myb-like DNA-binding domain-containing protein [Encephalitozoon hellem]WEL38017.1 SANT/Myb-like DNA-binding domain-containing protein [Encephalitozoon hellem]|eukprot:XP_003886773.1 hypothetical protein EHEL_020340 [Encephalitozoon hellem ATCC 50504]
MKLEKVDVSWTKIEDEILKAGVMKYGINKWSKVSSLLPSKTPSQCRHRWQEYTNPLANNSGWNAEEDEKLILTVKTFHPQWSLIGQAMGRSGQQCYERYNELVFGKIDVFKYGELEKPCEGKDDEILKMANARISECKNRKDLKKKTLMNKKERMPPKNDRGKGPDQKIV